MTLFFIFPSILVDNGETIIYLTIRSVLSFTKSEILLPIAILVSFNQEENIIPNNDTNYYVYRKKEKGGICSTLPENGVILGNHSLLSGIISPCFLFPCGIISYF